MLVVQMRLWRLHFPGAAVVLVLKRPILMTMMVLFQDLPLANLRVLVMLALVSLLSLTLALHLTLAPFWMPLVLHKLVPPLTMPVPLVVLPIKLWLATDCYCNRLGMWLAAHQVMLMFALNASWTGYLLCPNIMPWADNKVGDYIILGTTLPLGKTLPQSLWL